MHKELAIYYLFKKIKEGIIKYINKIKNYEINEEDILIKIQQSIINKEKTDEAAIKVNIKSDFENKFNDIENLSDNDFGLLMDFIFFLEFFDFKSDEVYFYINKWKNTFIQSKDYITKIVNNKQNIDFYKYDFEDNKLSFKSIIP